MINDFVLNKVRTFAAKGGSLFGQKEAEKLWKETGWKLALEVSEIMALQDGWAEFVVKGDNTKLTEAGNRVSARLQK